MEHTKTHTVPALTIREKIALALQAEKSGRTERAIELFEQVIPKRPITEIAHKRLMLIYRKQKDPKEELRVLDRAIKIWREYFKSLQDQLHAGNPARPKIKKLSLSIEKKLSSPHVEAEPLQGWLKRKKSIQNKLRAK